MFGSLTNPSKAYTSVGVQTDVSSADPHKLILMLFDGALMAISSAKVQMQRKEIAEKGKSISQAINIISNGLNASLDERAGGDLADKLGALYEYMCSRLLYANIHDNQNALDEVSKLLDEIRSAWVEIADNPAVVSHNKVTA